MNKPPRAQARVLLALCQLCLEREPLLPTVDEIAERAGRAHYTTHAALNRLVRDGYADRVPNTPRGIWPTPAGYDIVKTLTNEDIMD